MKQFSNYVVQSNLSEAWLEVFRRLTEPGVSRISPLVVNINEIRNGQAIETPNIRETLDTALAERGKRSCETVSNTIFPCSLWNPARDRDAFFNRYRRILPRIRKEPANKYGVYAERLIAFRKRDGDEDVNQLDHIIDTYRRGNHRHSALQAAIFDPSQDHTNQKQRGFPCLQQVAFDADHQTKSLSVIGFYAKQYIFDKAYGNYLGLCTLGAFMAYEMGLELKQIICIASVAELGSSIKKSEARKLLEEFRID